MLGMGVPMIRGVEVRVYIHATEDREKVLKAVEAVIPRELQSSARIIEEEYQGHYGNPIRVVTVKLEDPGLARKAVSDLFSKLSSVDKEYIADSLDERVDRYGALHLRVNKQDAFQGRLVLYDADDVIKITVYYSGGRRKALGEYKKMIEASIH